jgi:hypothetical protein
MSYEEEYKRIQWEQKKATRRKYYSSHKEKIQAYYKAWIAAHPGYQKEYSRKWRSKRKNGRNNDI